MMSTVLLKSDFFTCGIVVKDKKVIEAAPIVGYMKGWSSEMVKSYCTKRGWTYERIGN